MRALQHKFYVGTLAILVLITTGGCGGSNDAAARGPEISLPVPTDVAPAAITALNNWQLTLPINAGGGTEGLAHTVTTQELLAGYDSEWFYGSQQNDEEGITFWAPVNGAKTANSPNARTELREVLDPSDGSVNWSVMDDYAEMSATLRVNQTPPANGKITIGQILGYNGTNPDVSELFKLIYEYNSGPQTAKIYGLLSPAPSSVSTESTTFVLAQNLPLSQKFSYAIRVQNNQLTVSAADGQFTAPIAAAWNSEGVYFRAGAALNSSGASATDGGRVTFFDLNVTHIAP